MPTEPDTLYKFVDADVTTILEIQYQKEQWDRCLNEFCHPIAVGLGYDYAEDAAVRIAESGERVVQFCGSWKRCRDSGDFHEFPASLLPAGPEAVLSCLKELYAARVAEKKAADAESMRLAELATYERLRAKFEKAAT